MNHVKVVMDLQVKIVLIVNKVIIFMEMNVLMKFNLINIQVIYKYLIVHKVVMDVMVLLLNNVIVQIMINQFLYIGIIIGSYKF